MDMFDSIIKGVEALALAAARSDEIRSLRNRARQLEIECGSCEHWMKLGECPREKMDNAVMRHRGPSMSAPICNSFQITETYKKLAAEWRDEADKIAARAVAQKREES